MRTWLGMAVIALACAGPAPAQEPAEHKDKPDKQEKAQPTFTPPVISPNAPELKVDLLISRFEGERRLGSVPYTLIMVPGFGASRVRLGIEVPIAVKQGEVQYRNVGTNVDCRAEMASPGRYRLHLVVEQSSVYSPDSSRKTVGATASPAIADQPVIRSFSTALTLVLGQGESAQSVATDPVSGEVLKVDVTLARVK